MLDPRVTLVQVGHPARLGRLATDSLVQRVTAEILALGVHLVQKETAIPAQWGLLVCLDFLESLDRRAWVFQDQRGILASVGRQVYLDLRAKASKDHQEIKAGLDLQGQRDLKDKESKGQRASRDLRA